MVMMAVILRFLSATKALEYKHELEDAGLVCDKDFTWSYNSAGYLAKAHAEFNFVDPAMETFYQLKWT
jgi:hypothetical protein